MAKSCVILVVVSLLVVSVAVLFVFDRHDMCGKDIVADVCEMYEQNAITGSLCEDMCIAKSLTTTKCMSTSPEKPVYKAAWRGKEIIIKQKYSTLRELYSFEHLENEDDCRNEISASVYSLFGDCENCSKLTDKLVDIADVDRDGHLSVLETKTIVKLLRTPEPAMLLVLNGSRVSLNLHGYCGPIYAVEILPVIADTVYGHYWVFSDFVFLPNILEPVESAIKDCLHSVANLLSEFYIVEKYFQPKIHNFRYFVYSEFLRHRVPSLEERFNFTILQLNGIFNLSNNLYGMIQACDNHLGNFGLSHDNEYKLLDFDEVYPQYFLQNLLSSKQCQSDEDCRIGDFRECMSKCNMKTGFCTSKLQQQLLQNICPTSFPLIFRNVHKDFGGENVKHLICVEKAIDDLAAYCLSIPVANNVTELYKQIEHVKEKIVNISMGRFPCNL